MKTFSEFIAESEQQSGALAAHLARTAADRASQSGTVGGTEKKFKKRPSLGLRRPKFKGGEEKLKDKGPRKPAPYRSGERPQSTSSTSIAKRSSQSIRNAGKNTAGSVQKARVRVEPTQRPAIKPTPPRAALPAGSQKPITPMVRAAAKQAALKAAQQRKALPAASS